MYTLEELERYTVRQLKVLAEYDKISYPKYASKVKMLDLLVQLEPEVEVKQDNSPCSVRVQRIRESV